MNTVTEIEAVLPTLSAEGLRRIEAALHRAQRQQGAASPVISNPRLRALNALQARLALDASKAETWIANVRDARR